MLNDNKEYKKTFRDEVDWKMIDQLHSATLNFSNKSLALKRIFVTVIGISVSILIGTSDGKVSGLTFIVAYMLVFSFWILDSYTYYYQEKLRIKMDDHFKNLFERNTRDLIKPRDGLQKGVTIDTKRAGGNRVFRALFNKSHGIYLLILVLLFILALKSECFLI